MGPPAWLKGNGFNPPEWLHFSEISTYITKLYGVQGPPVWLLKIDTLPKWFEGHDVLPDWLINFGESRPPDWVLEDDYWVFHHGYCWAKFQNGFNIKTKLFTSKGGSIVSKVNGHNGYTMKIHTLFGMRILTMQVK